VERRLQCLTLLLRYERMFTALSAAVDELERVDPHMVGGDDLSALIVDIERQRARLEAIQAGLVGVWDARKVWAADGAKSAAAWLAHKAKAPAPAMRALVRFARRLAAMPHTAAAVRAGHIGAWEARLLADANRPEVAADFARDEEMLVGHARTLGLTDFGRAVRYWEQLADPDGAEARARDQHAARRAHLSKTMGGIRVLDAAFDPVGGAAFERVFRSIETDLFEADWAAARAQYGPDVTVDRLVRSPAQRRHDTLVEMARRAGVAPRDGKAPRPLVTVVIDYPSLLMGRICELGDGTVITPGQVHGLLSDADIERVVFGPRSRIIDVGRRTRLFKGALRRAIQVRDRHCTHPGCDTPAEDCDIDHTRPHAHGGDTTQDNGNAGCPRHNHNRQHGFTINPNPDGTFTHRRLDGTEIT